MTATGIPEDRQNTQGMGLHIMGYRSAMIGGRLEVSRNRTRGTSVSCVFPMRPSEMKDIHMADTFYPRTDMRQRPRRLVLVVDDHPLLRQGLALLINQQQDMQVCGEAEEAHAACSVLRRSKPDIMILDISLKGPDGLELLKSIRALDPDLPVLILSMHDEAIYAERALRARANGYIMKQEATEKVLVAVRRILNGDVYLSDSMSKKMLQQYIDGAPSILQSRIAALSDRELEVFRGIGEGRGHA